ncbi:hypothetical protein [Pseudanabaena sp. FACHB-2040]|uniref:hypothetical protein n=1 Tax=Pseudanabaena sp. FACHB-2040 TaxID=2692859 RepID=UPI0016836005|nr:hypothetical protein [Pseudanabaena sp. FACHB-2040]MBD2261095.1 hypothetical protein [Pseudanabaena sp. FACHB-2040]
MPQFVLPPGCKPRLKHLALAYALMALTLASCSSIVGSSAQAGQPEPLRPYGSEGSMTAAELSVLKGLAWPQQYGDMVGTFGFPYYRSATADYYQVKGSATPAWVVVYYKDRTATGYGFEHPPVAGGEL